jgi:reactive intermediate/imine deaminase
MARRPAAAKRPRKEIVEAGHVSRTIRKAKVPLSAVTRFGDLVFVSGIPPFDAKTGKLITGNIDQQTEQVLKNVKVCLEEAGSSLENVLKVTVFCTNAGYFNRVNKVYGKFFKKNPPARTFCTVGAWPWEFDIEIECIAAVKPGARR